MIEPGERAELRRLMGRLADGDRTAFGPVFALLSKVALLNENPIARFCRSCR